MFIFVIAVSMFLLGNVSGVIIMAVLYIGKNTNREIKFKNTDSDFKE